MAIYTLGSGASRIAGSRSGATFQKAGVNFTIRKRAVPKQKRTARQSTLKNALASNSQRWRTLNGTEQGEWDAERFNYQRFDSLGNAYFMQPNQMQVGSNQNLVLAGITPINQPASSGAPAAPVINAIQINIGISEAVFDLDVAIVPANRSLKVFATAPRSEGQEYPEVKDFKLVKVWQTTEDTTGNIWNEYTSIFQLGSQHIGQRVFGLFYYIQNDTGQQSDVSTRDDSIVI